jgi:hypothetical protein
MTRNRTTHSKPKSRWGRTLPWMAIFIGGLLFLIAIFFFSRGGQGEQAGGAPAIQVDQQVIDYGQVKLGTSLSFKIKVTNVGSGTLRFTQPPSLQIAEGC